LVSSEVNSKYFASTSEQTEKNEMVSRFASTIEEQILSINEAAVLKDTRI